MQNPARAAYLGAAVAAAAVFPGLGSGTLWDNSETAYGEVAREIVLGHDWIVMHQNGQPWFVQPPLYFWLGAIFIKIFGVTSFALRLPAALATIVMGAQTAYVGARAGGARAGIYAGVILSTCLMQAVIGRLAIMDALLDAAVATAIFLWFRALQTGRASYYAGGAFAAGLGALAKGPVAPVIALLVIVPWALLERRRTPLRPPRLSSVLLSVAVFCAIVLPWFAALVSRTGWHSIGTLIGYYTVGRYTGTIENQTGPVWYYVPALILGFFPWIAFLPSAVASAWRKDEPLLRLALLWSILPLLFFSFAKTKLANYIALEMPGLALLVAFYLDEAVARARSRSLAVSSAAVFAAILLLAAGVVLFARQNRLAADVHALVPDLALLAAVLVAGGATGLYFSLRSGLRERVAYAIGAAMVCAMSVLALFMLPHAEPLKPIPHLAQIINQRSHANDAEAIMNVAGGNALIFYTHPGVHILRTLRGANAVVCGNPRTFFITAKAKPAPAAAHGVVASWGNDVLYLYSGCPRRENQAR